MTHHMTRNLYWQDASVKVNTATELKTSGSDSFRTALEKAKLAKQDKQADPKGDVRYLLQAADQYEAALEVCLAHCSALSSQVGLNAGRFRAGIEELRSRKYQSEGRRGYHRSSHRARDPQEAL